MKNRLYRNTQFVLQQSSLFASENKAKLTGTSFVLLSSLNLKILAENKIFTS
jgi:hypothetical protein